MNAPLIVASTDLGAAMLAERTEVDIITAQQPQVLTLECLGTGIYVILEVRMPESTLLHVVAGLFDYCLRAKLGEGMSAHMWNIKFRKKSYAVDKLSSSDIDPQTVPVSSLNLKVGDKMAFEYDYGSPTLVKFVVAGIRDDANRTASTQLVTSPAVAPTVIASGPFTPEEITESNANRKYREDNPETTFSRRKMCRIPLTAPNWTTAESEAVHLLIYSGMTFTKGWKEYMEPSLLNRSKASSSGKWYQYKKQIKEIDEYHNTKHWLFYGGRQGGERELPSKEKLIERATAKFRAIRRTNLNAKLKHTTITTEEEYMAIRKRKFYSLDSEDWDSGDNDEDDYNS